MALFQIDHPSFLVVGEQQAGKVEVQVGVELELVLVVEVVVGTSSYCKDW